MKKILMAALVGLMMWTVAGSAWALGPVDATAQLDYYSKYVWRGVVANSESVLQPSISAGLMGINASIWGNMDLTDVNGQQSEFSEIDYTVSYGVGLPMVSVEFGFIHYRFPDTGLDATTELFASAELGVLFSPSIAIYRDIDEVEGTYISLGASHDIAAGEGLNLELSANLGLGSEGWTTGLFGAGPQPADSTDMTDLLLSVGAPFHPVPLLTVTPSVSYSTLLSGAKDAVDAADGDSDAFYFGVSGAVSF